jgi:hypothetical protein
LPEEAPEGRGFHVEPPHRFAAASTASSMIDHTLAEALDGAARNGRRCPLLSGLGVLIHQDVDGVNHLLFGNHCFVS